MITGCDVSSWQGKIDFQKMASKVQFVIMRACYGSIADRNIVVNWSGAKAAGIPRGAYLYFYPNVGTPVNQARAFMAALKNDNGELPLTIDVETPAQAWSDAWRANLQACIAEVERIDGRKPILYTGNWFMPYVDANKAPWLADHHLWLGEYVVEDKLIIPKPWTKYTIWQYTSSGKGADYGVASDNIDLDVMSVPLSELMNAPVGKTIRITSAAGGIDVPLPLEIHE